MGLVVVTLAGEDHRRLERMAAAAGASQAELAASLLAAVLADDEAAHEATPAPRAAGPRRASA